MSDLTRRCLSVVMPCFNEAATIEAVAASVLASPYTAELIIVDDGSTDGTLELARTIDDSRIRVLAQPHNQGKGAALRRGFSSARAEFVIVQDADLEYDPKDYHQVLEPLLDGRADVVFGSRFQSDRPHRVLYYWHSVGNKLLTTASNMLTNLNLTDMETCYKAFRLEVIQSITIEEARFGFEPEITAKVARGGWRVYEVGISYAGRTYNEGKKIGWRDGIRALFCILRYSALAQRLRRPQVDKVVGPVPGNDGATGQPGHDGLGLGRGEHLITGLDPQVEYQVTDAAQPEAGQRGG
jgi:glycosyltransferase involved in cell wall biosynthesis